jgi:hypothetical protein
MFVPVVFSIVHGRKAAKAEAPRTTISNPEEAYA